MSGGICPWVKCPGDTCPGWGGGGRNLVMIQHYGVLIPKEDMAAYTFFFQFDRATGALVTQAMMLRRE